MFNNIITCPWKHGQLKDGVDSGAYEIMEYIKSKYAEFNCSNPSAFNFSSRVTAEA